MLDKLFITAGKVIVFWILSLLYSKSLFAQKSVQYSPTYFGPNALPIPEVSNGKVPKYTQFGFSSDYSFGFGDRTVSLRFDAEIPLLPNYISLKSWFVFYEKFWLTPTLAQQRTIEPLSLIGATTGDVYLQTRFLVFQERKYIPNVIIAITIKTASGGNFEKRRFYDTPGYYFDATFSKSFLLPNKIISNIQLVGNLGFLCWETTNSTQNDAPMYGLNLLLSNKVLSLENQIGGYWGWMNNGDKPLTFRSKLTYNFIFYDLFLQYQYGIIDFPYHQVRMGVVANIPYLTPKYK
ncbi:MAG: hypothetical protein ACRC0A_00715 [Chitinophagaceae bacterium]